MPKCIFILLAVVSIFDLYFGQKLDYEEIKALGASCSPRDSCSLGRAVHEDNLSRQTCECKPSCTKYGTCCIDSPHNQPNLPIAPWPNTREESCSYLMGTSLTLIVTHTCKTSWQQDPEVKSLCETPIYPYSFEDPLAAMPVTNPKTSKTYKNYFCALCHDDTADIVYWNINVTKKIPASINKEEKKIYEDANFVPTFTYKNHQWDTNVEKLNMTSENGESDGRVSMVFSYPPSLEESITTCYRNVVSDCHPAWTDETIKNKCHSYMGMIYSEIAIPNGPKDVRHFRNVHCAICNFAGNASDFTCSFEGRGSVERTTTLSFSWLLDVNPSSGGRVGEINKCMSGEVYDPFFEKCRALKCGKPEYKVKDGKCEPS